MSSHFLHLLIVRSLPTTGCPWHKLIRNARLKQCGCEVINVIWLQVLFYLLAVSQLKYKQIMQCRHAVARNLNEDFHSQGIHYCILQQKQYFLSTWSFHLQKSPQQNNMQFLDFQRQKPLTTNQKNQFPCITYCTHGSNPSSTKNSMQ